MAPTSSRGPVSNLTSCCSTHRLYPFSLILLHLPSVPFHLSFRLHPCFTCSSTSSAVCSLMYLVVQSTRRVGWLCTQRNVLVYRIEGLSLCCPDSTCCPFVCLPQGPAYLQPATGIRVELSTTLAYPFIRARTHTIFFQITRSQLDVTDITYIHSYKQSNNSWSTTFSKFIEIWKKPMILCDLNRSNEKALASLTDCNLFSGNVNRCTFPVSDGWR